MFLNDRFASLPSQNARFQDLILCFLAAVVDNYRYARTYYHLKEYPSMHNKTLVVGLTPEEHTALKLAAVKQRTTMSDVVRSLVSAWLSGALEIPDDGSQQPASAEHESAALCGAK